MIVKELTFRPAIRDLFFPGATLNVSEIRSMLLKTGDYTNSELSNIADETVEQFIERLRNKEPRYDYQVSYHAGNAGVAALEGNADALPPNTILSTWRGNRSLGAC